MVDRPVDHAQKKGLGNDPKPLNSLVGTSRFELLTPCVSSIGLLS